MSDGYALAAASAAAAGLVLCMQSKRASPFVAPDSVCASARRATTSARVGDETSTSAWDEGLFGMSAEGEASVQNVPNTKKTSADIQRLQKSIQPTTECLGTRSTRGTITNITQMAIDNAMGGNKAKGDPSKVMGFGLPDIPECER